jgi:predicted secreted hydrolase
MVIWPALLLATIVFAVIGLPTKFVRQYACGPLEFPRDHGRHHSSQSEWWHLCGNLESPGGREWGYQFTVFRYCPGFTLGKDLFRMLPIDGYVGHLIITNCQEKDFRFFEAGGSPLLGFAGAANDRLHLWVSHWSLSENDGTIRLSTHNEGFGSELTLMPRKPPVLHGDNGFCRKTPIPGHASVHYSLTSLETSGTLTWQGEAVHVTGKSWLDREWGTQVMPPEVKGWNWACLHLENDHEIMLHLIRLNDGTVADTSYGTIVPPDGGFRSLTSNDFRVQATGSWRSDKTAAVYPMGWSVRIPSEGVFLEVEPVVKEHEQVTALAVTVEIDYWEGPVRVTGTMKGKAVQGKGYVELGCRAFLFSVGVCKYCLFSEASCA